MHFCLQIPEIVDIICAYANAQPTQKSTRSSDDGLYFEQDAPTTILALALTCKYFYEPATAAIWMRLDGLRPLVRCMGSSVYQIDDWGILRLRRPIEAYDIAIMKRYTHRIRYLRIDETMPGHCLPIEVYHAFNSHLGGQPWIPNLRRFAVVMQSGNPESIIAFIQFLINQELTHLDLWENSFTSINHQPLSSFLTSLPKRHPNLISIELMGLCVAMRPVISRAIQAYHDLVHLKIPILEDQGMRQLANLPSLRSLTIHGVYMDDEKDLEEFMKYGPLTNESGPTPFPSLRCLVLEYLDLFSHYTWIFSLFSEKLRLERLELWGESWSAKELSKIVAAVADSVSGETLASLRVHAYDEKYSFEGENNPPPSGLLEPLKKFVNLQALRIFTEPAPDISDNELAGLCACWPQLSILKMSNRVVATSSPERGITLQAVEAAASTCPMLTELSLNFDARTSHLPDTLPSQPVSNQLKLLGPDCSPIDDANAVATLLHQMFPQLEVINSWYGDETDETSPRVIWKRVGTQIETLRRESKRAIQL